MEWRSDGLKSLDPTPTRCFAKHGFHRRFALWCGWMMVLVLLTMGCRQAPEIEQLDGGMDEAELQALRDRPLRVLCVGPSAWADEMTAQYTGQFEGKIEIVAEDRSVFDTRDEATLSQFDVLVVPPGALPPLAESRQLLELRPEILERLNRATLLSQDQSVGRMDRGIFGISLGTPYQVMCYNDQASWDAVASGTLPISVGTVSYPMVSWADWHAAAVAGNEEQLKFVQPLANGGAARALLMRGAAYARSQTQVRPFIEKAEMRPLINQPAFVTALREMQQEYGAHTTTLRQMSAGDAVKGVRSGQFAATISNLPKLETSPSNSDAGVKTSPGVDGSEGSNGEGNGFRLTQPPSAGRYFNAFNNDWSQRTADLQNVYHLTGLDGRVACILRSTRKSESSFRFLTVLSNSPTAELLAGLAEDTGPFKSNQLNQLESWFGKGWDAESLRSIRSIYESVNDLQGVSTSSFPPVLGQSQLIENLDQAVIQALESQTDAQQVLDRCADQWLEILEQSGRDRQAPLLSR